MTNALVRKCNGCGRPFLKEDGCNKMTCSFCKHKQCYVCSKTIYNYEHFDNPLDKNPCPMYGDMNELLKAQVSSAEDEIVRELLEKRKDLKEEDLRVDHKTIVKSERKQPRHQRMDDDDEEAGDFSEERLRELAEYFNLMDRHDRRRLADQPRFRRTRVAMPNGGRVPRRQGIPQGQIPTRDGTVVPAPRAVEPSPGPTQQRIPPNASEFELVNLQTYQFAMLELERQRPMPIDQGNQSYLNANQHRPAPPPSQQTPAPMPYFPAATPQPTLYHPHLIPTQNENYPPAFPSNQPQYPVYNPPIMLQWNSNPPTMWNPTPPVPGYNTPLPPAPPPPPFSAPPQPAYFSSLPPPMSLNYFSPTGPPPMNYLAPPAPPPTNYPLPQYSIAPPTFQYSQNNPGQQSH